MAIYGKVNAEHTSAGRRGHGEMIKSEIVKRLNGYPSEARFTICTKCLNVVHACKNGDLINRGSSDCRYPVREVSLAEIVDLLK